MDGIRRLGFRRFAVCKPRTEKDKRDAEAVAQALRILSSDQDDVVNLDDVVAYEVTQPIVLVAR